MNLFLVGFALGKLVKEGPGISIQDELPAVVASTDNPLGYIPVENQTIESERWGTAGPETAFGSIHGAPHGVSAQLAQIIAVLVVLDIGEQARGEGAVGLLARRGVHDAFASLLELAFEQEPVEGVLGASEAIPIPGHHDIHIRSLGGLEKFP